MCGKFEKESEIFGPKQVLFIWTFGLTTVARKFAIFIQPRKKSACGAQFLLLD
jgi:hypothetical protein